MIKRILAPFILMLLCTVVDAQDKILTAGMRITTSTRIKKSSYRLAAPAEAGKAVITIEGSNITIDFNQAELAGSTPGQTPDQFTGLAIHVRDGKNITIKNLRARGYKIALLGSNIDRLTIINCDLGYNYRPHLNSTQEKEDVSDWMSYHHNEKDEWMRYGAAIYLRDCDFVNITGCKVTGGQNALMMTRCNDGQITNNDFSFNSGIGIGMYRSSRNSIINNRIIFNVRGYSHGIYNRGQDSAGILVYEQSNDNLFYRNNVTHGGDGFFLWAGQTTMDNGQGGCNDNLLIKNDFSYAPTNGIEVTFSRNRIVGNRIFECDHGIWGGYSYQTEIEGNQFRNNRIAIAIEHGQQNKIINNLFSRDKTAIRLWARKEQPADWGYAKYRDTRSAGYTIAINSFNNNPVVFDLVRTDSIQFVNNTYFGADVIFKTDSTVTHLDSSSSSYAVNDPEKEPLPVLPTGFDPFMGSGKLAGRKNIMMTEWGPYDFRSPIIWHTNPVDRSDTMRFELFGPKGKWVVKKNSGLRMITGRTGQFPATIFAIKEKSEKTDVYIELEYTGEAIVTTFGEKIPAGRVHKFHFSKFFQPLDWEVLFFSMDTAYYNPIREPGLFPPNARYAPVKKDRVTKLEYAWWGGLKADQVYRQFITIASTNTDIPPGKYELSVTWDDAVRIYMDDKLILDEWNPSKYSFDESPNRRIPIHVTGKHQFRVEHLELGGFATLAVKLHKAKIK
jgi:parallel beta-helix repeat protein